MHPRWPYHSLDLAGLKAGGWRPQPFREFVLKVHQRCNLACTYCYVYESPDRSWRERPRLMSDEVWRAAGERIGEHAARHGLAGVRVVLHGGEPLLAGPARLRRQVTAMRATTGCELRVSMQTNGVGLDERALAELAAADIRVGVSVDGTAQDHDRHRVLRDGRGSHAAVTGALRLLASEPFRHLYGGLLCTVDPASDPVRTYRALLSHEPPAIDLLLPHANWASPPSGDVAAWLIAVFDEWYAAPSRPTRIRLFEDVMNLLLGGSSGSEQVGLSPVAIAVVESDGDIEQVDALKSAYAGACATGRNVRTDAFDTVLTHPGVAARQIGVAALADGCLTCPVHRVCGGGHYAHRYRPGDGFRNPTVYCADMSRLIGHVRERLRADLTR
ncbi:FxsB family cyclophane-forming radical SAM/SPASM peptide maturase [Actinoplanes sp. DH11]|uniref:FxsB family cyclophane-forming radical SAM/SPASM peptide maturase n=1 Tax=Actinoplanes sp. DH11 TaxID=2857011 RepID=UPI001E482C2C|nr:FxsB family cyclophane-forming radical SAM/SPASM peptide maturase [Actinoplanes sp. DH11]